MATRKKPEAAQGPVDAGALAVLRERLLAWFAAERRDLPWRRTRDPYRILVSEVMLQQTQVPRVVPKYEEFIARFPTLEALAAAPVAEVIRVWEGLGYNRRAVRLHAMAREMVERWGRVPEEPDALLSLDGVGKYTAAAVAAFAFGAPVAAVDTNIRRVLVRLFLGDAEAPRGQRWVEDLAQRVLPVDHAAEWNGAVMELGAMVCQAGRPRCGACPVADLCRARDAFRTGVPARLVAEQRAVYRVQPRYEGSSRYFRGRIVQALREAGDGPGVPLEALGPRIRDDFRPEHGAWLEDLVQGLARDGLVALGDGGGGLTVSLP